MLRSMRDGAKSGILKFFLMGLLVMAAGGLVLTDVGGFFRGGGVSSTDVAKGKGFTVGVQEFDRSVRRTLAQQGISPQQAYQFGLVDQILTSEIQTRMLSLEAQKHGLMISDEDLVAKISELTEPLATDGMSKKDALTQVLRAQGISEGEFVQAIRNEMRNELFRNALSSGATFVSDKTARDLYQYENQTRDIKYFELTLDSLKDIEQPTDIQLENYYETIKSQFLIAERRSFTIATLKQEALESSIEITDADIQDVYDDQIDRYAKPETRAARQAVTSDAQEAEKIAELARGGVTIEKAVQSTTGKKTAYMGESDFEKAGLLEEIAEPVFSANEGDVIGPIQTALGFHILSVEKIKPARTQPLDEVKDGIKNEILQNRLMDEMMDTANLIDDRLASGEELEAIVADIGLTTEKFSSITLGGLNKKAEDVLADYAGDKPEILDAAFTYETGESSPVMEMADGRFITVRIDDIEESSFEPLEEKKENVKAQWLEEQRDAANRLRVSEVLNELNRTKDFKAVAESYNARIKSEKGIERFGTIKSLKSTELTRQIFDVENGDYVSSKTPDGHVIAVVRNITLPDASKASEEELATIKTRTENAQLQDIITQFIEALSDDYDVKINKNMLDQLYAIPEGN